MPPRDFFTTKLVKDPSRPPETLLLRGYPGASSEEGHERLYTDADLSSWIDVPKEAVLHTQEVAGSDGLPLTLTWVQRSMVERLRGGGIGRAPIQPMAPTPWSPMCPPRTLSIPECLGPRTLSVPECFGPRTRVGPQCPPLRTTNPLDCFAPRTLVGPACTVFTASCPQTGGFNTMICPSAVDACPSAPGGCDWQLTPNITPLAQTPLGQGPGGGWGPGNLGAGFGFGFGR